MNLTDKLEIHIIELPKIRKNRKAYIENKVAQWMLFLNNPNDKEVESIVEKNEPIKEAMQKLKHMSEDEELRRVAELRQKAIMDEKAIKQRAMEVGLEEGRQRGIKEGKEEGRKEGRKEGIKEGRNEKTKEIAKKMLAENIEIEVIEKITGLSRQEIENI